MKSPSRSRFKYQDVLLRPEFDFPSEPVDNLLKFLLQSGERVYRKVSWSCDWRIGGGNLKHLRPANATVVSSVRANVGTDGEVNS